MQGAMGCGRSNFRDVCGAPDGSCRFLFRFAFHCAAVLVFTQTATLLALQPSASLGSYGRQAWTHDNGLPQNTVQAITQTRDGFLWVGTEAGLARFDGVEFDSYDRRSTPALPGDDIRSLVEAADGALWIASGSGLARWHKRVLTFFTERDGVPPGAIRGVFQTTDNSLWVWADTGLKRLENGRFVPVSGVAADSISQVISASDGSLWVASPHQMAIYRSGHWSNLPEDTRNGQIEFVAALPDGASAVGTSRDIAILRREAKTSSSTNVVARLATGRELPGGRVQSILADREGSLWIGTNQGLVCWAGGKVERFPLTDPLATASVLALAEDREGDLWVGTETGGLQVLRDHRFQTFDTRTGLSSDRTTTVVADRSGKVWIGTQNAGVFAINGDITASSAASLAFDVDKGLPSNVILSMATGDGHLWVGTPDGLSVIHRGEVKTFTSADGLPDDFVRSLLVDVDGSLWIGTRRGLALWKNASRDVGEARPQFEAETYTRADGLGSDLVGATVRDARGDLWIATLGGLSRLHGKTIANYTTANGLTSNIVTSLLPLADGTLLIGTQDRGLTLWDGHQFTGTADKAVSQRSIHAMLHDKLGHIWFATDEGIARCDWGPRRDTGRSDCSHWIEFDTSDGLVSRETSTNSHPSAWRSDDGRLWFATPRGVVEVDPAHFRINDVPPGVVLKRLEVDDVLQPLLSSDSSLAVQPGHVRFQFDYAGLSFVAPQKVRYRYKLDGFDRDWTEAGARRSAYYTNIPPGQYTFRVQAANNDGVWNTNGAELRFELKPHYYQTRWFLFVVLMFAVTLVLLVLRERLRRAERGFQAVLAERTRIAREIHDTLAQGYVGVSVQLEVLAQLLRQHNGVEAAAQLDKVREYVRSGLAEARQSIWALRTQDRNENTLPIKLRRLVEAAKTDELQAEFSLFGAYRALSAGTEQEVVRIVQEAIQNVKKHSEASLLSVQLTYDAQSVVVEICDNGRGGASEQTGRFGLVGMRERAASAGGTLEIDSVAGAGTKINLRIPTRRDGRDRQREN